ncbi:hypothetical protein HC175_13445 [Salinimicrobium sp. CDJ15-91]|uniref:UbiA prenyltransferase family protein n=1 Tax=Salinimicrobium oceani TaxID=2722702 RepID=A0ABX1D5T4_9FLAO|nr:hypothetical protein [Salinimicrobium oceani]
MHFEAKVQISLLFFTFFGTATGYNFVKYAGVAKLHHRSLASGLKMIQVFSFFCFLGLLATAFLVSEEVLCWTLGLGLLTLLYALPVFSNRRNLRSFSGLKIFIIALVWTGVTVILPLLPLKNVIFEDLFFECFQRFLLVLVLILPFEIRDLKYDLEQLGTIPQRVGITATKVLGLGLLLVIIGLEFFKTTATIESEFAIGCMAVITAVFVWRSKENQSQYFAALWVEAIPILWLAMLWVLLSA